MGLLHPTAYRLRKRVRSETTGSDRILPWFDTIMPSTPYSRAFSASCSYPSITEAELDEDCTYMDTLYPLEDQWSFPIIPQKFQVFPITKLSRVTFLEPLVAKEHGFFRLLISTCKLLVDILGIVGEFRMLVDWFAIVAGHKDRVRSPHLIAYTMGKGHECFSKIVGSPSYCHCIKGDHQSFEPVTLGPTKQ
jgi:hypothetical protein